MCTVTWVPTRYGLRVVCSRDESRHRVSALPPRERAAGDRRALMPIDPVSGGTWIAVNDAGLVFALLNRNPYDMRGVSFPGCASRGEIIPELCAAGSLDEAAERVALIAPSVYAPFRLVVSDLIRRLEVVPEGPRVSTRQQDVGRRPVMLTSSGLGDDRVESPRRALFDGWFGKEPGDWLREQDGFHRHRWPNRPEISVCMSREDALTVSVTTIELAESYAAMTYHPAPPDQAATPHTARLEFAEACRR